MRHRVYGKHLGRDKDERATLFKSLVQALFTHGSIETSETKAKAVRGLIDKVINLAKNSKTRFRIQSFITDKSLQERLIKEIAPKLSSRNSGYTSLVRLGTRFGDQAMMVKMSLIGAEELKPIEKVTGNRVPLDSARGKQVTVKKAAETKKVKPTTSSKKPTARKAPKR